MKAIPSFAAVLLALALPALGAVRAGATAESPKVVVPERGAHASAPAARTPQGLTPTPGVVIESPPFDLTDGGSARYGFYVENTGTSPLPGPFTIETEAFGLSNGTWAQAGWSCTFAPPAAACTWPSDLPPGSATPTVNVDFDVTGPYDTACGGERSPCVWFQAGLAPDLDRVFTTVVIGGNHAPVAGDDAFYTRGPTAPMTLEVLANDTDPDFDTLWVEFTAAPAHGTAVVDPSELTITYVPDATYAGFDTFHYRVRDGDGATDTAQVTIRELTGSIAFDTPLHDIGQVEIQHVAMRVGFLENTTGVALAGTITVEPVPAAEIPAVLAGTGYDPARAAFDPDVFKPVDGQAYSTFDGSVSNSVLHYARPLSPLETVWLARLRYDLHPFGSPGAIVSATVDVVARSATTAEVPIHVLPDVITVPPDVTTMLRPLANDDSVGGNPLSVTALHGADPWSLDPDSAVGLFDFGDPQGPNGTLPYLGILYTPPPGYTGTNAVWYAASEIVNDTFRRYDFAKITLHVAALPPPPVAVASGTATICAGGSAPLTGSGGVSCAWTPAAGLSDPSSCAPTAAPAATTTYSLVVTDQFGQTSTNAATATVTVEGPPTAVAGGTATILLGQSTPLSGSGGVSCAWSPAAGLDDPGSCAPLASPVVTTTYALVVTSAAGCASVNPATATITVLPAGGPADLVIPFLFAPNQAEPGDAVTLAVLTRNDGANPAGASVTRVYLSTDAVLDAGDSPLGATAVAGLAPGQAAFALITVVIPGVSPDQYYLIAAADDGHAVPETDETNNTRASKIHVKRGRP